MPETVVLYGGQQMEVPSDLRQLSQSDLYALLATAHAEPVVPDWHRRAFAELKRREGRGPGA
jgi:hypothetical protein